MKPIYFFMHLAKTGGTTFIGNLYKYMTFEKDFTDFGPNGIRYRKEHYLPEMQERSKSERDNLKIIIGHLVYWDVKEFFPEREHRFVTFLREPVSRVISHYTYDTSRFDKPFDEWYANWIPNQMYAFLCDHLRETSVQGVLEKLKTFWHIGIKEDLDKSLKQLFIELGLPTEYINRRVSGELENTTKDLGYDTERVIKPIYKPTPKQLERVQNDHKLDTWMYEHIKKSLVNYKYVPLETERLP